MTAIDLATRGVVTFRAYTVCFRSPIAGEPFFPGVRNTGSRCELQSASIADPKTLSREFETLRIPHAAI
jgi:hypothetical protein